VVLDLLLIGLGITLEPFPLTAFILVLGAEKGAWLAGKSIYLLVS
jgi:hypothetical protein